MIADITTSEGARSYIANFKHVLGREATYVQFGDGVVIHFNNMTDDEAIKVANALLFMEIEAGKGTIQ